MKRFMTPDGSETFYSEEYKENYHTRSGAKEEMFKKYVEPCHIRDYAEKGKVIILDFCFGMGYATAAALDAALAENPDCAIEVWGLEKDDAMLQGILDHDFNPPFESYHLIKNMLRCKKITNEGAKEAEGYEVRQGTNGNIHLKLLLGDAHITMHSLPGDHFDAIFFIPFSPPKNPALWQADVFKEMKRVLKKHGVLSTYSCAKAVRNAMQEAGFIVKNGPLFGSRSPSTLCTKE